MHTYRLRFTLTRRYFTVTRIGHKYEGGHFEISRKWKNDGPHFRGMGVHQKEGGLLVADTVALAVGTTGSIPMGSAPPIGSTT